MAPNSCATCRFWDSAGSRGLCRRNAPRAHMVAAGTDVAIEARWPETAPGDWCGQHEDAASLPVYRPREAGRSAPRVRAAAR